MCDVPDTTSVLDGVKEEVSSQFDLGELAQIHQKTLSEEITKLIQPYQSTPVRVKFGDTEYKLTEYIYLDNEGWHKPFDQCQWRYTYLLDKGEISSYVNDHLLIGPLQAGPNGNEQYAIYEKSNETSSDSKVYKPTG